jgi:hypothetical protein
MCGGSTWCLDSNPWEEGSTVFVGDVCTSGRADRGLEYTSDQRSESLSLNLEYICVSL